jgi:Ca2+:H+ antiporter
MWFQAKSHHGLYDDIFEADEHKDADRHKDLAKEKLTFTECIVALSIAIACVSMIAVFLVEQIHYLVEERHVKDAFVGLILLPLVEKAAGRYSAVPVCQLLIVFFCRTPYSHRRSLGQPS